MPKTKISEFSATPANNTDIDSINIAEGCAPSGINDAIRELMAQLKDFQTGAVGDSFNGPIGATTASTGAFTTLSASSTLGVTGVSTLTGGAVVQGLTVGRGAGAVATNTAVGASALAANTTGANNTGLGNSALISNTTGNRNSSVGRSALGSATTGSDNSALGYFALQATSTGANNTAVGVSALQENTTASNNTAVGYQAGYATTTGANNLFLGYQAGYATTTAYQCTAIGANSLKANVTNLNCVAVGYEALLASTGNSNTALGKGAGSAITTGYGHTIIGAYSGNQGGLDIRTAGNHIVLSDGDGSPRAYWNNSGRPFFPDLGSDAGTNAVRFNTGTGRLSYDTSSARYKDNIRDSVYGLSHVMQMRSTQFEYKEGGRSDVGLIAEELQPIVPELVGVNKEGQADSVSYDRMVSVLVKAIQELKAEFDAYKSTHP